MSKKNIIALILVLFFLVNILAIVIPFFVSAKEDVTIKYNNKILTSDVSPVIHNDRVLVPVRMIFEAIGAEVGWNAKTEKVTIINGDDTFIFTINSDVAYKNDKKYQLDTVALLISDRTFIPLRFLAENSGMEVEWSDEERTVYLSDKKKVDLSKYNYLTNISLDDSSVTVTFKNENITFNKFVLSEPNRLVVDIDECIKDFSGELKANGKYYTALRCAQFSQEPMVTRLVFELTDDVTYTIEADGKKMRIEFFLENEKKEIIYKEPVIDKKYPTIVIDAGHGGKDPGALGEKNGAIILQEKDVNLAIALSVYNKLKEEKVNVYMTRSTDKFLELSEIASFANSKNADLFVSVHNNAADNTALSGSMVMYAYDTPKDGYDISGKEVAETIQKYLVKATKAPDLGARKNSSLYVVRKTNMPAVITESLFVTNDDDRKKLMDSKYINDIADAIYKGICEVMDL